MHSAGDTITGQNKVTVKTDTGTSRRSTRGVDIRHETVLRDFFHRFLTLPGKMLPHG